MFVVSINTSKKTAKSTNVYGVVLTPIVIERRPAAPPSAKPRGNFLSERWWWRDEMIFLFLIVQVRKSDRGHEIVLASKLLVGIKR